MHAPTHAAARRQKALLSQQEEEVAAVAVEAARLRLANEDLAQAANLKEKVLA